MKAFSLDMFSYVSSMCGTLEFLTSLPVQDGGPPRRPIQDGGPHGVRSKMAAPRSQIQDGDPCDAFGYTSEGESTP